MSCCSFDPSFSLLQIKSTIRFLYRLGNFLCSAGTATQDWSQRFDNLYPGKPSQLPCDIFSHAAVNA